MKAWIVVAALAATGLTGKSALAASACGPWGNDEIRCIGSNGLESHQPKGLDAGYYTTSVTAKSAAAAGGTYKVNIWHSLCGLPGIPTKEQSGQLSSQTAHFSEYIPTLACVEFFVNSCRNASHQAVSCRDVVSASIRRGRED